MKLNKITKHGGVALLAAAAIIGFGTLTACSSNSTDSPATATTAPAMPESATFIADMPGADGQTMTMAVQVDGDKATAYATDGSRQEAMFFGSAKDRTLQLKSMYQDTLTATYDDGELSGMMTMNEPQARPQSFNASAASGPAGIYTAEMGDARAIWVVRPDGTSDGMMMPNSRRDRELIDRINQQQQDYMDRVRQMRIEQQVQQAPALNIENMQASMGGHTMTATRVTGDMSF